MATVAIADDITRNENKNIFDIAASNSAKSNGIMDKTNADQLFRRRITYIVARIKMSLKQQMSLQILRKSIL